MKVYVARQCGFCKGVRTAVDTALSVPPENTYVLGELIHNPDVVSRIAARGIITANSLSEVPDFARLLIRSHGVGRDVYAVCKERGIEVIDCTCSFVRRTQEIVARESAAGKFVVIAGQPDHPEVRGLVGWCGGSSRVVSSETEDLSDLREKDVVLVAQTTFSEKRFSQIAENLQKVCPKTVEIFRTICYTTVYRQSEAERLAKACDAVVVIGGLNSSNTNRLAEIVTAHGGRVIRVNSRDDFRYEKIKFFGRVGVIAGASTPDWLTQEVLCNMVENNAEVQETEVSEETKEVVETAETVETAEPVETVETVETETVETAETVEAAEPAEETPVAEETAEPAQEPAEVVAEPAPVAEPKSAMEQIMDDIDKEERYRKGQIITVRIVSADDEGIFVSGSGKLENKIAKADLDCEVYSRETYEGKAKAGESIEVMVVALNPTRLSEKMVKKIKEEEALLAEIEAGKEFTVVCTGCNKGGLTAELGTYPVFVPRREIRVGYVQDIEKYKGKTLRLKLIEIRKERRKEIIASQRVILEAERAAREAAKAAKEESFFASIQVGDVVEGKVERVTKFGAFVSVNGFDCLAHISDLSWTGVNQVTDVLEIGKRYEFKVLKVDAENKKVSIGYKQLQPQPWDLAAEKYAVGDVVHGKVVRLVSFGAFVELEKGIDGLVHVSQITHEWLENPTSALEIGQEVDAKILAFDPAEKKITLSIKALQPRPEYEPRPEREEGGKPQRGKKSSRRTQVAYDDPEEAREWSEDNYGGISISELLGNNEDK